MFSAREVRKRGHGIKGEEREADRLALNCPNYPFT